MTAGPARSWESTLDSVVVYAQGAVCRRLARGTVPPDGRVRVTGLPRTVDPGSLRARVRGSSGPRVTEARVEAEAGPLGAKTPQGLRDEAERLKDAYEAARERRDRMLSRIEEVGALRPVPPPRKRDDPHRRTPVDAWLELAGFVDERLTGLHHRLAGLEEALRAAEHEWEVASDRLARASTDAPSAHVETSVGAVLTVDGAGEVELELEYGVPGAVWVPAYRLAYRQGDGGGRLVLRASVAQRTGEDWTGVRIALATADLRRRTDLPKLRSIRIGRSQPVPAPAGWREPPAGLAGLFSGYDAAGPRPAPATGWATAAAGSAPAPLPPPPPPPTAAPKQARARTGHGGPPPAGGPRAPGGMPLGSAPVAMSYGAAPAPAAPGGAPAPVPPPSPPLPAGPPEPTGAELDYESLVLSGPDDEQGGRRGRLFADAPFDPVVAEHRRRAEAVAALPLPGHAVRPRTSAGSFDHRYDAAARADVPSDGTWHTVTVGEIPVGLRAEYLCVPSVEQTVYATLVLSNATDQALLAGPVEVTVDDEFLLTAALPTLAPGAVRRVGLGPAEGVRVTRRTNLHESTSGLRGNTTVLNHGVRVELANGLARPVRVEVHERVPVTSDPDVRIEERAGWTVPVEGAGPDHHAPGTRVWRLDLAAGATAALDGGYEIRIPTGKALVGGNRRS
ncbi:DUF4139 domain-containing protein [Streptomyces sp. NBC_00102]|uniref:DUF4139 domain-containing protein n=1 Tax=Streptomyces sp. NBC_00102 TaxID=2975652 RepID=UPI00224F911A|nr:DUF4139 domain-containing protein [Streptomyces sp. NBC_00102]MCX5401682.1 DUF4139 domain-containing protein [Streptomyces sp. NBC_00102]